MRTVTAETTARWKSVLHAGNTKPTVRATLEHGRMREVTYNTENNPGGDYGRARSRKGHFRNIIFGATSVRELPNVRRCEWSRSVDQDIAECTLTLVNIELTAIGDAPSAGDDFDTPGALTFNRGDQQIQVNRWGQDAETGWNGMIVPDRLIRTYEGYGSDDTLAPGDDPNLYPSGTWLIDDVSYAANGDIVIKARDLIRLLVDHISHPPVVPYDDYPMEWSKIRSVPVANRDVTGGTWGQPKGEAASSNIKYADAGIVDTPRYVNAKGGVQGRYPNGAYRGDQTDFWISTGQESHDSMVWWEVEFDTLQEAVAAVRIRTQGGPYRIFISIKDNDGWLGKRKVPYDVTTEGVDLDNDIPFVHAVTAEKGEPFDVVFKRKYLNVKKIRLSFTRLRRIAGGKKYDWRAGLREFKVYTGAPAAIGYVDGEILTPMGNYADYTDIVKWVCAWSGFFWPTANDNFIKYSNDGPKVPFTYAVNDSVLPRGRVWGSFQMTNTAGVTDLTSDQFDKQPLLDVIQYVRDVTGFSFWADETGGIVWRMPNLYELGNYLSPNHKDNRRRPDRTTDLVTIDEEETLISYSTELTSRNLRERVFVANSNGKFGIVVKGFNPYPTGLKRIAGWTDQHWVTKKECRVAADMIVAAQTYDYRRAKISIPGNPAIQIDDQIRVFERVTNESFYHYVRGISSVLDMDEGSWTYELESHWLGEKPGQIWAVNVDKLDAATQNYINLLGDPD